MADGMEVNDDECSPVYTLPVAYEVPSEEIGPLLTNAKIAAEVVLAGMEDVELRCVILMLGAELCARGVVQEVLFTENCACDGLTLVDPVGLSEHHSPDCPLRNVVRPEYQTLTADTERALVAATERGE